MVAVMMKRWGWTPNSTSKFGCDVNIKSIPEEKFSNKWVGSLINWYNSKWEVILSIVLPSKLAEPVFRFCDKVTYGCY